MEVEPKKLITSLVVVFLLGVGFALLNGFYFSQEGEALPLIVYGMSFLSIMAGAFIVLLFQWKINKSQLEKILNVLPREERIVIKILLDNKNHIEQNYLVALSDFNKVTISRTVSKLEERKIIEKKRLGNTNMIILKL